MTFELKVDEDPRQYTWKMVGLLFVSGLGAIAEQLGRIADALEKRP